MGKTKKGGSTKKASVSTATVAVTESVTSVVQSNNVTINPTKRNSHRTSSTQQPTASKNQKTKQTKQQSSSSKRTTRGSTKYPTVLKCPETGESIYIATATVKDIKDARALRSPPWYKSRHYLVTVPSPQLRKEVYDTTAAALADLETQLLPTYGGRSWQVTVTISDDSIAVTKKTSNKNSKSLSSPFFVWSKYGELEVAALPNIIEKIPNPPKFPGFGSTEIKSSSSSSSKQQSKSKQRHKTSQRAADSTDSDDEAIVSYKTETNMKKSIGVPSATDAEKEKEESDSESSSSEEDNDEDDVEEELTPEQLYWKELQEREITNISTLAYNERHRVPLPTISVKWTSPLLDQSFRSRTAAYEYAKQLCQNEVMIDRYIHGYTANGMKVVAPGQITKPPVRSITLKVGKLRFERDGLWIIGQEQSWQQHRIDEIHKQAMKEYNKKLKKQNTNVVATTQSSDSKQQPYVNSEQVEKQNNSDVHSSPLSTRLVTPSPPPPPLSASSASNSDSDDIETNNNNQVLVPSTLFPKPAPNATAIPKTNGTITTTSSSTVKQLTFQRNTLYCLNNEQIALCYKAGIDHYDTIMRTVTARDLTQELQDGFDLLRERGRGRFDMELPVFDTDPRFSFLTDLKKAPWMPVVRQILGNDVTLIHKGMFLSMPGSDKQEYHQDGLHLNKQHQRPCHAINVFIPLVDLLSKQVGPTEFCLGSHILGNEQWLEKYIFIPSVRAGCPIIFDYRLGHRGLANTSKDCRPIVYCTYAPVATSTNGSSTANFAKEFRDSINFSRKRYRKIGDLVETKLTREERIAKRARRTLENDDRQQQPQQQQQPEIDLGQQQGELAKQQVEEVQQ